MELVKHYKNISIHRASNNYFNLYAVRTLISFCIFFIPGIKITGQLPPVGPNSWTEGRHPFLNLIILPHEISFTRERKKRITN